MKRAPYDQIHRNRGTGAASPHSPRSIRALLLQSLHPLAMAGVAGHSGYKGDPWGRLQRTSEFLATTTFGTIDHAEEQIARVRSIHDRVRGKAADGTTRARRRWAAGEKRKSPSPQDSVR